MLGDTDRNYYVSGRPRAGVRDYDFVFQLVSGRDRTDGPVRYGEVDAVRLDAGRELGGVAEGGVARRGDVPRRCVDERAGGRGGKHDGKRRVAVTTGPYCRLAYEVLRARRA